MADDHPDGSPGQVAVNGQATGRIDAAPGSLVDFDSFEVALVAGATDRIDLEGADTGAGTLDDPDIYGVFFEGSFVRGSGGDEGGAGRNASVVIRGEGTGAHTIAVRSSVEDPDGTGTYRLSVTELAAVRGTPGSDWLLWSAEDGDVDAGAGTDMLSFVEVGTAAGVLGVRASLGRGDASFYYDASHYYSGRGAILLRGVEGLTGSGGQDHLGGDSGGQPAPGPRER